MLSVPQDELSSRCFNFNHQQCLLNQPRHCWHQAVFPAGQPQQSPSGRNLPVPLGWTTATDIHFQVLRKFPAFTQSHLFWCLISTSKSWGARGLWTVYLAWPYTCREAHWRSDWKLSEPKKSYDPTDINACHSKGKKTLNSHLESGWPSSTWKTRGSHRNRNRNQPKHRHWFLNPRHPWPSRHSSNSQQRQVRSKPEKPRKHYHSDKGAECPSQIIQWPIKKIIMNLSSYGRGSYLKTGKEPAIYSRACLQFQHSENRGRRIATSLWLSLQS